MTRYAERNELDGYNSSREIMEAIELIAGDRFTGKADTAAHKIWDSPSVEQTKQIIDTAWKLADTDALHWGDETYRRGIS